MSRSRRRSHVRHGPFCSDDELYFSERSRDFDYPMFVNGRRIGHLIPGNVMVRSCFEHFRGGLDMPDIFCEGGLPLSGNYGYNHMDIGPEYSSFDQIGIPNYHYGDVPHNPYDPRQLVSSSYWCPGSGLGVPCCSNMDTMMGGFFRMRKCPRGMCQDNY